MIKKILIIIPIIVVIIIIILISPLPSLILKSKLESQIKDKFNAEINFENFNYHLLKGIEIDKISFYKNNFNIKTGKTTLKFNTLASLKKNLRITCVAKNIRLDYKSQNIIPLAVTLILDESDLPKLKEQTFDHGKLQVIFKDGDIFLNNIEAISKEIKIFGNIVYKKEVTHYDLDLYIPSQKTESMPEIAKLLLNVQDRQGWSKFDIILSIPNKK